MTYYVFLGTGNVGKSHLLLYTAKLLANSGRSVLAVDTTYSQGLFGFINVNRSLERVCSKKIMREGVDILSMTSNILPDEIGNGSYDIVLVEADDTCSLGIFEGAEKIFVVQNYDHGCLIKNKEMMATFRKDKSEKIQSMLWLILNQTLKCKFKKDYAKNMLGFLPQGVIEVPYSEDDYRASLDNKVDGKLILKKFSFEHNAAIYDIANQIMILPNDNKSIKKLFV